MVERVRRFMEQWNMVRRGDEVLLGLSGGADSVCLCLVLKELAEPMGFSLRAVHVEHGIRGEESLRDMQFVRDFCEKNGLPLVVRRIDVPGYAAAHSLGTEEAARILRYQVYEELAGSGRVALAHHGGDNAETVLMALLRGSGLDGLCGMPPVREGRVPYIRPLLAENREAIEDFLRERGQGWCTDSTNLDTDYTRNFVRREIMPRLAKVNPQAAAHMNRTAAQLLAVREYMEEATQAAWERVVTADAGICLDAAALAALPAALRERVVHRAIGEAAGGRKDIGAVHVAEVLGLLNRQSGRSVALPGGVAAVREFERICLRREPGAGHGIPEISVTAGQLMALWEASPLSISLGEGAYLELAAFPYGGKCEEISIKMYTKWFDYDMIKDGFSIRGRKEGDYFLMDHGHHKKLHDYFIDEKIPAGQRDRMPLLAVGSEVIWLVGGRMGMGRRVTERTKKVLSVSYIRREQ